MVNYEEEREARGYIPISDKYRQRVYAPMARGLSATDACAQARTALWQQVVVSAPT